MTWRPLLSGALRDQARSSIEAIARAVSDASTDLPDSSISRGHAGVALLFGYLDQAGDRAAGHLDRALDGVAAQPAPPSLHGGFVGVGWVGAHLDLLDAGEDAVDLAVAEIVGLTDDFELMNGLAGLLVHARARPAGSRARQDAARIVSALAARFDDDDGGAGWAGPRSLLGVAHGIAGIAAAVAHSDAGPEAVQLARAAVGRVLARRHQLAAVPNFGWCHADIGVAASLLATARALEDPALAASALELARAAAPRHRDDGVVRDASFCHGSAGLGHLFNRVFQATGDPSCAGAAQFWYTRALDARGDAGVGGYRAWIAPDRGELRWCDEAGVLHGAAGVALALLAATTDREPSWDRAFGLS